MRISEYQAELEKIKQEVGDVYVFAHDFRTTAAGAVREVKQAPRVRNLRIPKKREQYLRVHDPIVDSPNECGAEKIVIIG